MLPKLPYKGTRREKEIVAFLGLNRTEATREGEVRDAKNMTVGEYPTLTQRQKRTAVAGYASPTDIYEWDGHLVVADGGVLYYDGEAMCNVSDGKKQYAVVNTKLIVWPDALVIDLTTAKVTNMAAAVTNHGTATLTSNAIEFAPRTEYSSREYNVTASGVDHKWPWGWVYDSVSWDGESWTLTGGALVNFFTGNADGKYIIPTASLSQVTDEYTIGPTKLRWSDYDDIPPDYPEPAPENDIGFYCEVNLVAASAWETLKIFKYRNTAYYAPSENTADLTEMFETGEFVDVEGTFLGLADGEHMTLSVVESDKLTFSETFIVPVWYLEIEEDITTGQSGMMVKWTDSGTTYRITIGSHQNSYTFSAGNYLLYRTTSDGQEVIEWNPVRKAVEQTISVSAPSTSSTALYTATLFDGTMTEEFTVSRNVPKLDYICASENRLWGVSNRVTNKVWNTDTETWDTFTSRVIYASELGQPMRFWTFSGADTDSYQVAVGSEDDFTAICDLGGVCCWKEHELVRVLGSYPSEFYTNSYRIEGVAEGCSGSLTIVNETLYYVGVSGVYAFRGTRPTEIGKALKTPPRDAVGGSDGQRWYLSGMQGNTPEMLTYDIGRGMWMREDETLAEAFAVVDNTVHFLSGGVIYKTNQGDDPNLEWYAEFVPFDETKVIRKRYIHLALRLDMSAGSKVTVEARFDGGSWTTLLDEDAQVDVAKRVMFPPRRCDRMTVRISGTGTVKLRHMEREYYPGSERV